MRNQSERPISFRLLNLAPIIEGRTGNNDVSKVVRNIIDRYEALINRSMPLLKIEEWLLVIDVLGHGVLNPKRRPGGDAELLLMGAQSEILAAIKDGCAAYWSVDGDAFCRNFQQMSTANLLSVIDVVERFIIKFGRPGRETLMSDEIKKSVAELAGKTLNR